MGYYEQQNRILLTRNREDLPSGKIFMYPGTLREVLRCYVICEILSSHETRILTRILNESWLLFYKFID